MLSYVCVCICLCMYVCCIYERTNTFCQVNLNKIQKVNLKKHVRVTFHIKKHFSKKKQRTIVVFLFVCFLHSDIIWIGFKRRFLYLSTQHRQVLCSFYVKNLSWLVILVWNQDWKSNITSIIFTVSLKGKKLIKMRHLVHIYWDQCVWKDLIFTINESKHQIKWMISRQSDLVYNKWQLS